MNCIPISTLWHFAMKDESVHIEGSKVCHETWWSVQFPSEHGVQLFGSSVSKCFKFVTWSSRIKPPPMRAEKHPWIKTYSLQDPRTSRKCIKKKLTGWQYVCGFSHVEIQDDPVEVPPHRIPPVAASLWTSSVSNFQLSAMGRCENRRRGPPLR